MKHLPLSSLACAVLFSFAVSEASAGDLLSCTKKNRPARSTISAEVEDLAPGAVFTALVTSGNNSATSVKAADITGNVEYDFDSNRNDILAGDTPISAQFINTSVTLLVTDANGNQIAQTTVTCRTR